jgi:hypothetical protein
MSPSHVPNWAPLASGNAIASANTASVHTHTIVAPIKGKLSLSFFYFGFVLSRFFAVSLRGELKITIKMITKIRPENLKKMSNKARCVDFFLFSYR